jgi:hypothetical protein
MGRGIDASLAASAVDRLEISIMNGDVALYGGIMVAICVTVIGLGVLALRGVRKSGRSRQKINLLAPVDLSKGMYQFTESFRVKYRPAQDVPNVLRSELIKVCQAHPRVTACYL